MTVNPATITDWTSDQVRSGSRRPQARARVEIEPVQRLVTLPNIDIVVFAEDSVLSGSIQLSGDRVTDVLNDSAEYEVTDAVLEDLADGHAIACKELVLQRDECIVIEAAGPRGDAALRRRRCQHPIVAKAGPYDIFGYLHTMPGFDPIASLGRRQPIVAITDAVIGYTYGTASRLRRAAVVMLNRECLDWIAKAPDDALMLDMPPGPIGRLTKDYTGALYH